MNNEIKEILDYLNKVEKDGWDNIVEDQAKLLTKDETKALLDCITNLQKNRDDLDNYNRYLHTELTNLQEENNKLLQKSYSDDVIITKAIGWVKKNMYYFPRPNELLNILNGEDNEKD